MIRVIVADDENLARGELVRLLGKDPGFQVVGQAGSGEEALRQIQKLPLEAAFLDIEMPGLNGLEVASRITQLEHPPVVVFVTAYHQYAIEAFEANAIDYILKPFDAKRLKKTLERIKERILGSPSHRSNLINLENDLIRKGLLKKIAGHKKNSKDRMVIDPDDVYYFYVHLAEVMAQLQADQFIVSATLKELLENLDPAHFVQCHKSYLVNINKVEKVSPMFSGNFEITLNPPQHLKIPLSRRYAKDLKSRLGNW